MLFLNQRIPKIFHISPVKKILIENFTSLSFLQITNYILPFITLPYLVRVLGVEKFGLIAFAQAFTQCFVMFTDYGFAFTATREISVNAGDVNKISEIFSAVVVVKVILATICFLTLCLTVFLIPKFAQDKIIYFLFFGVVIGNIFFPAWLFQGMEKMKYSTFINVLVKIAFTIPIFIFIKTNADFVYLPLIISLGYLSGGAWSLYVVFAKFGIYFKIPKLDHIRHQFIEGWHIFVSMIFINLSGTTNIFILGFFANNIIVGYYAAAEKIIITITSFFSPVFQAVYPHISHVASHSREMAIAKIRKLIHLLKIPFLFLFLVFFLFAKQIVLFVLGSNFYESILLVKIMSPILLLFPVSYVMLNLILLPFKLDRYFLRISFMGGIINLFLLFLTLSILKMGSIGAAVSNLLIQIVFVAVIYMTLKRHDIKIFNFSFRQYVKI